MRPTWRALAAVTLALGLVACDLGRGRDDDDDDDEVDLTDLEWSMVGVWRGSRPDDRWEYYVFEEDRTGCTWIREGDNFDTRFDEIPFRDWALDADALDDDFHIPLSFVGTENRELYDSDEYDLANDRILPSGLTNLAATWISIRIACDGEGSHADETDVVRWGTQGNGYVGQGDPNVGGTLTGPGTNNPNGGGPTGGGTGGPTGGGTTGGGTSQPNPTGTTDTGPTDTGTTDTGSMPPTGPQPP